MCTFMRNKIRDNFNTRIFLIWFNIQVTIIFLLNATTYVTMALYIKEEEASLISASLHLCNASGLESETVED